MTSVLMRAVRCVRSGANATCALASWPWRWQVLRVSGQSMAPGLLHRDFLLVDRRAFGRRRVERGDVVVLSDPREAERRIVKRVMGVGGDRVAIRDGQVLVDGAAVDEPFVLGWQAEQTEGAGEWHLEEGELFVLGDNREASADGRTFGPVAEGSVMGRAVWRLREPFSLRRVR